MEIKKTPKADLEGKKGIFFEIGLVVALGILLCAFNWKANTKVEEGFVTVAEEPVEEEIIPITQQMMKPPPPPPPAPKLTDLIEIVDQELDIDEELEIEDVEANVENRTDYSYDYDGTGYDEGDYGEEDIFQVVEDMPTFPGDINKWLGKNVKYPVIAQENNIQGRVTVQFVIERDGSIIIQPFLTFLHFIVEHREHPYFTPLQPNKLICIKDFAFTIHTGEVATKLFILRVLEPERKNIV